MTFEELRTLNDTYVLNTYSRFPIGIDRGEGAVLFGTDGKRYIDFTSGIGVCSVGYANPKWAEAVFDQCMKLGHISNLFYTEPPARLAEALCRRTGMAGAFFANSGAESNEGVIKLARKYSFDKYGRDRATILTLNNSFHGRTITTLAATGQEAFHNYFFPFTPGFRTTPTNDMAGIDAAGGPDVCAVLLELVQGEGGVYPVPQEFVHELAVRCAERDWLLLIDEVQTGVGRTGTLFAFQQYGILPDAVSFAKGIAGGLPFGGFLAGERCRNVLGPGTHATTFGGNPVCSAAALAVLGILNEETLAGVREKAAWLRGELNKIRSPYVTGVRGLGLMLGIGIQGATNKELAGRCMDEGLLVLTAGGNAIRLLPPLTITRAELEEGLAVLRKVLAE
ncbi:MAG TPA: aspartate aminotransferase family protein [Oscillospiraceae bacterium]|nr:aspartate aminotransferase family protein [Oscillospiraceae bacterium]